MYPLLLCRLCLYCPMLPLLPINYIPNLRYYYNLKIVNQYPPLNCCHMFSTFVLHCFCVSLICTSPTFFSEIFQSTNLHLSVCLMMLPMHSQKLLCVFCCYFSHTIIPPFCRHNLSIITESLPAFSILFCPTYTPHIHTPLLYPLS